MNIVLVHGAWADGSSWRGVIGRLQKAGHNVMAPQFPLTNLADNVARLRQVLALQDGPTVVAGHSYGGQIMTALGTDAPNVVGLVYVAAFGLDEGESIGALLGQDIMYAVQQPLTMTAFDDVMGTPAWKNVPSWFAVAQSDEVIPPDAERLFAQRMEATVVEVASSHVVMVSHPDEIADLIETAVQGVTP
jgi:pimeloyl-ACP methyl ester carboxylesterase